MEGGGKVKKTSKIGKMRSNFCALAVSCWLLLCFASFAQLAYAQDYDDVVLSNRTSSTPTQEDYLSRPERVTLVAPRLLRPRTDYHVLVNLANSRVPAAIEVQLVGARDSNREQAEIKSVVANSGETQTLKFAIGDWPPAEYVLNVTAEALDRSWRWTQESALQFQAKSYSAFIQTDKAIYKPGQLVQARAVFLNEDLKPEPMRDEINVTIVDSRKNLIKQWTSQSNYRGLLELSLQLSEDPPLGDWTLKVEARGQEFSKQFRVAEYVLPTFEVALELPQYATYAESDIVAVARASYTYGKPVSGHATLTVQPLVRFRQLDTRPLEQAQYRARLANGSAEFSLNLMRDLRLEPSDTFEREIEFFAIIEEDLTGRKYNATNLLKIYEKNIKVERVNAQQTFKPGLEHLLQLKVAYQDDTPVEDGGPELELRVKALDELLEAAKLQPAGGLAEHLIRVPRRINTTIWGGPRQEVTPQSLELEVRYRKHTYHLRPVSAFYSKSEEYLQISLPQVEARQRRVKANKNKPASAAEANVGEQLKIRVRATERMAQVTCQCLARGDIIWALSREARNASEFEFEVEVQQRMAPEARIICFYVRPQNKELIADSLELAVGGLLRNSVKLSLDREQARPGQEVKLAVATKPRALVGLLGVDQSVLLLRSGNDFSQEQLLSQAKSFGAHELSGQLAENAAKLFETANVVVLTNNLVYDGLGYAEGPHLLAGGVFAKTARVFRLESPDALSLGPLVLGSARQLAPAEFHLEKRKPEPLVIRSQFPETWLWETKEADGDGGATFRAKAPDTITSWVVSAFALSESHGFGLTAGPSSLRVFRPFFVKLNLPYAIVRGETVSVQALVFNYSKRPANARVTLDNKAAEFEFVEAANSVEDEKLGGQSAESRQVYIGPHESAQVSFLIKPRKLGQMDVRVLAESEFAGDGLVKKLLVKPEGQTQHLNRALLLKLDGQSLFRRNFSIEVPANAVADSQRVYVNAVGDLLGPGLSNLDDLLRLPYGCGEQNMINLVPNIVILNYLEKSGRLREAQRVRAKQNIESGYQRQLNYKRSDGSFSAFGPADANGSVWLTAYVLKSFQQARSLITVDESVVRRAANFIARFSRQDGSIQELGMLHNRRLQSEAAASGQAESSYLTAYAMIALLQRPIAADAEWPAAKPLDEVLERGLDYLEGQLERAATREQPYEAAIIAYALQLAPKREQAAARAYELLWAKAQEKPEEGLVWWQSADAESGKLLGGEPTAEREVEGARPPASSTQPPLKPLPANSKHSAHLFVPDSLSIEMSALALLCAVRRGELERALPVARWLISQQNSRGGFASTQDTVLAIEALAAFAEATRGSPPKISLELIYPNAGALNRTRQSLRRTSSDELQITSSNALVNQQIRLPDNITWLQLEAAGSGLAVVQVAWQYNLLVSAEQPAFYLNPVLDRTSTANYLQLSVCTFYRGQAEASNMAVMEVELPSGYTADVEALPGLRRTHEVKRVDTANGDTKVLIYFDRVTRDEICLTVPAHRTSKVSGNAPAPVSIYDYYNRQQAARIFYEPLPTSSCDICDADTCSRTCSSKVVKKSRLVSLHQQRLASLKASGNLIAPPGGNSSSAANSTLPTTYTQILPLAPVLMTLMTFAKNLAGSLANTTSQST